jgi:hypothetical protein
MKVIFILAHYLELYDTVKCSDFSSKYQGAGDGI